MQDKQPTYYTITLTPVQVFLKLDYFPPAHYQALCNNILQLSNNQKSCNVMSTLSFLLIKKMRLSRSRKPKLNWLEAYNLDSVTASPRETL